MNLLPVVMRELRAESRRPFNYALRVLGGLALLVACALAMAQYSNYISSVRQVVQYAQPWGPMITTPSVATSPGVLGSLLFGYANAALFASLWLLVPLLTADSVNREKREGTLGLLFLTPLTPAGVVGGKCFVHGLRGLTLFLTMVPILAIPVLLGGVSSQDILMAFLIDSSAFLLALAAGLLASCLARDPVRTVMLAEVLSAILCVLFMSSHRAAFDSLAGGAQLQARGGNFWISRGDYSTGIVSQFTELFRFSTDLPGAAFQAGWGFYTNPTGPWSGFWTDATPAEHLTWFVIAATALGCSVIVFGLVMWLASLAISRSWRDAPASARRMALEKLYLEPRFWTGRFRRRRSALLGRNPSAWLQQYSVMSRITKWGWCLFILIAECVLVNGWQEMMVGQTGLAVALLGGLAFSAAASFRQERDSGALELLLVTPLRIPQLISGRQFGLWIQFLPSVTLLFLSWIYSDLNLNWASYWGRGQANGAIGPWILISTWLTLPTIGMYFSITRPALLHAWLLTFAFGVAVPFAFLMVTSVRSTVYHFGFTPLVSNVVPVAIAQLALAATAYALMCSWMRRVSATGLPPLRSSIGREG